MIRPLTVTTWLAVSAFSTLPRVAVTVISELVPASSILIVTGPAPVISEEI